MLELLWWEAKATASCLACKSPFEYIDDSYCCTGYDSYETPVICNTCMRHTQLAQTHFQFIERNRKRVSEALKRPLPRYAGDGFAEDSNEAERIAIQDLNRWALLGPSSETRITRFWLAVLVNLQLSIRGWVMQRKLKRMVEVFRVLRRSLPMELCHEIWEMSLLPAGKENNEGIRVLDDVGIFETAPMAMI